MDDVFSARLFGEAFVTLFVIMDPPGTLPLFLALTAGQSTRDRGRAAWQAVFPALQHNPVPAARHAHLTGRAEHRLTDTQARVAVAASLLRQRHAVITTRTAWDPAIAAGLHHGQQQEAAPAA